MASINSHCDCAAWTGWLDVMSSHVSSCRLSISLKRPGHSPLTSATNKAFYHSEPPLTGCFLPFLRLLSVNLRNIRVSKSQQISNFWNTNVAHTNNHATLKVTEITSLRLDFFKHQLSFIVWKGLVLILFLFVSMSVVFFLRYVIWLCCRKSLSVCRNGRGLLLLLLGSWGVSCTGGQSSGLTARFSVPPQ